MIDEPVNVEELAENRSLREAAENATDDGMPEAQEHKAKDVEQIHYKMPKQWVRRTRKWAGSGRKIMHS